MHREIADTHLGEIWDSLALRYSEKLEALSPPDPEALAQRDWNRAGQRQVQAAKAAQNRS